jgi:two-component system, OmpR family, alkaline phosphatase synthesis response regulator PhoP
LIRAEECSMLRKDRRVLAVDDNPVNLEIVAELLGDRYRVKLAQSSAEAIRIAEKFQPGIILLDVMMPDADGLRTCQLLRAIPGLSDSAIIMVSAKAMPSEQAAGMRAGADEYITKPFDDNELLEVLRRYSRAELGESESNTRYTEPEIASRDAQ